LISSRAHPISSPRCPTPRSRTSTPRALIEAEMHRRCESFLDTLIAAPARERDDAGTATTTELAA
jgi:hypothetical protein